MLTRVLFMPFTSESGECVRYLLLEEVTGIVKLVLGSRRLLLLSVEGVLHVGSPRWGELVDDEARIRRRYLLRYPRACFALPICLDARLVQI